MAVSYNDSVLSYVDYYDGAWHVLWYELEAAGSYVAWADPDRMVVTELKTGKAVSVKESLEEKGETVSFLRRTEGKFYTVVENQEIGKLMLGIYSLSGE